MAVNQGAVRIIAPPRDALTVTLLLSGSPATLYSDAAVTTAIGPSAVVAAGTTQTLYVAAAGNYKMSVHDGTAEVSRTFGTMLLDLGLSSGDMATQDYSGVAVLSTAAQVSGRQSGQFVVQVDTNGVPYVDTAV